MYRTDVKNKHTKENKDYLIGRNCVSEALKSGRVIDSIFVSAEEKFGSLKAIVAVAKEKGITVKQVKRSILDSISNGVPHQGVAAVVGAKESCSVQDILNYAKSKNGTNYEDCRKMWFKGR